MMATSILIFSLVSQHWGAIIAEQKTTDLQCVDILHLRGLTLQYLFYRCKNRQHILRPSKKILIIRYQVCGCFVSYQCLWTRAGMAWVCQSHKREWWRVEESYQQKSWSGTTTLMSGSNEVLGLHAWLSTVWLLLYSISWRFCVCF